MPKEKYETDLVVIASTTHLNYRCVDFDQIAIEKFQKESVDTGKASFAKADKERGITIDIALWKF